MKTWPELVVWSAALFASGGAVVEGKPSPANSQQALAFLLESAAKLIPEKSSCQGIYGAEVPPRIADLLAMELANLTRGRNSISGSCSQGDRAHCTVAIDHAFCESVSSAEIEFDVKAGLLDINSIACALTP